MGTLITDCQSAQIHRMNVRSQDVHTCTWHPLIRLFLTRTFLAFNFDCDQTLVQQHQSLSVSKLRGIDVIQKVGFIPLKVLTQNYWRNEWLFEEKLVMAPFLSKETSVSYSTYWQPIRRITTHIHSPVTHSHCSSKENVDFLIKVLHKRKNCL